MKHAGFEARLDGILALSAARLTERMKIAYLRGTLAAYLQRIGLAEEMETELESAALPELQERAREILAARIRRARRYGYLKECLRRVGLLELLHKEMEERRRKKPTGSLKLLAGSAREGAGEAELKESKKRFTVLK